MYVIQLERCYSVIKWCQFKRSYRLQVLWFSYKKYWKGYKCHKCHQMSSDEQNESNLKK